MKVTFLRKYLDKQADTGFKVFFSLSSSVFTLPRWDIKITLAPWFIAYLMVRRLDFILVSSVISPSFIGTLKSHLIITFFPSKSKSFIVFFMFSLLSCNICICYDTTTILRADVACFAYDTVFGLRVYHVTFDESGWNESFSGDGYRSCSSIF